MKNCAPEGSLVVFACKAGKVSHDGEGANGLFTKHLLEHMETPQLHVENMMKRVTKGVRTESLEFGEEQRPYYDASIDEEDGVYL